MNILFEHQSMLFEHPEGLHVAAWALCAGLGADLAKLRQRQSPAHVAVPGCSNNMFRVFEKYIPGVGQEDIYIYIYIHI